MAVHAVSGSLTQNVATTATLTGWEKYVLVTVTNGATAAQLSITTDGTAATVNGADTATVTIAANATVTVALKNNFPKPQLTTSTPLATDPSALPVFSNTGSKVSIIGNQTGMTYNIDLAEDAGTLPIYS